MEAASCFPITDVIRAQVIVVAKEESGLIDAPLIRIALVFRTSVAVVAIDRLAETHPATANVVEGAGVSIIALPFDQGGFTGPIVLFITDFKCAWISVVTIEFHSKAQSSGTCVLYSTESRVVTGAFVE